VPRRRQSYNENTGRGRVRYLNNRVRNGLTCIRFNRFVIDINDVLNGRRRRIALTLSRTFFVSGLPMRYATADGESIRNISTDRRSQSDPNERSFLSTGYSRTRVVSLAVLRTFTVAVCCRSDVHDDDLPSVRLLRVPPVNSILLLRTHEIWHKYGIASSYNFCITSYTFSKLIFVARLWEFIYLFILLRSR